MLLLLIRHAHAGDRDPERWPDDRDRPLTDKGRKTQRNVSRCARQARARAHPGPHQPLGPRGADRRDPGRASSACRGRRCPCDALADRARPLRLADDIGEPGATRSWRWWAIRPGWRSWRAAPRRRCADGPADGLSQERRDGDRPGALEPGAGELRFFLRPKMAR